MVTNLEGHLTKGRFSRNPVNGFKQRQVLPNVTKPSGDKILMQESQAPEKKQYDNRKPQGHEQSKTGGGPSKLETCYSCGQAGHYSNDLVCPKYNPEKYKGKQCMHMQRVNEEGKNVKDEVHSV